MLAHRVGEVGPGFDVGPYLLNDLPESPVLFLLAQNLEALHERQSGVEHDRELAREDGYTLGADPVAGTWGSGEAPGPSP